MSQPPKSRTDSESLSPVLTLVTSTAFSLILLALMMAFAIWVETIGRLDKIPSLHQWVYGVSSTSSKLRPPYLSRLQTSFKASS